MRNYFQSAKSRNLLLPFIWATLVLIRAITWSTPAIAAGSVFYVAPYGTPAGNGSMANPWDLATALAHPLQVQPGDTIWLRGGTYTGIFSSYLTGTVANPIVVRSYPGEWAVIDTRAQSGDGDNFEVWGSWTYYWGLELMNSRTTNRSGSGFAFLGSSKNNKFINMIIHDLGNNTFRDGNEIYGSVLYNNGVDGSDLEHQLYVQNGDPGNPVRLVDSIVFNGFAFGVHAYSGGSGQLNGIELIGNVWFNNGVAQTSGNPKDNVLIAGANNCPDNILLQDNMGWASGSTERSVKLGRYCNNTNGSITLTDNYLVGDTRFYNSWQSVTMTGNTFYSFNNSSSISSGAYPGNSYLTTAPTAAKVFIQPNQYESGRAHIVVYNWDLADVVDVDVSSILNDGDVYQLRNAQNYFASPVASGIYKGESLSLPMTGLQPSQPVGPGLIENSEYTGKEFNVFILIKTGSCSGCTPRAYLPIILK